MNIALLVNYNHFVCVRLCLNYLALRRYVTVSNTLLIALPEHSRSRDTVACYCKQAVREAATICLDPPLQVDL